MSTEFCSFPSDILTVLVQCHAYFSREIYLQSAILTNNLVIRWVQGDTWCLAVNWYPQSAYIAFLSWTGWLDQLKVRSAGTNPVPALDERTWVLGRKPTGRGRVPESAPPLAPTKPAGYLRALTWCPQGESHPLLSAVPICIY